ncbi:MAG: response regulator [Mesorhizobium sp.]|uniref:response regulator n=1 Tax=Mesorhizobium sp. M7A.F.Ca.ET.027.02.1.1 TaxID=2496655 RepID=UPI000FD37754|nr:response regulator [Mesorhizobium sp. M7A.F.Ca.ET.027.02.1.1]RVD17817.1 response regulator [Mesorhizobium sp. M7A.F.Ca.ET.027.02.1.1]RWD09809.1 MAG: response regulator [Mesorhizobium sp.]
MKVLLVEDEEHKAIDLTKRIARLGIGEESLTTVQSVREAVLLVVANEYDLIILDMALPTFSKTGSKDNVGGEAQPGGGVEILRALDASGRKSRIIVVTQYPEVVINGEKAKPHQVAKIVAERYRQIVLGTVIYSYNTPEWETAFDNIIARIK